MKFACASAVIVSFLVVAAPSVVAGPVVDAVATPSGASLAAQDHFFLTDNIGSGVECNPGNPPSTATDPHPDCLQYVNSEVADGTPWEGISVNEACQSDYEHFQATHPNWDVHYVAQNDSDGRYCGRDAAVPGKFQTKGDFVAAPTLTDTYDFPMRYTLPGSKDKLTLICGKTTSAWICTIHLPYLNADNVAKYPNLQRYQVREIADDVEGKFKYTNTVVAGDFNMTPSHGSPASFTRFRDENFAETDPSDRPTTNPRGDSDNPGGPGVKFDYIWYHRPDKADVTSVGSSIVQQPAANPARMISGHDHDLLTGSVVW